LLQRPAAGVLSIQFDGARAGRASGGETVNAGKQRTLSHFVEVVEQGKWDVGAVACEHVCGSFIGFAGRGSECLQTSQLAQGVQAPFSDVLHCGQCHTEEEPGDTALLIPDGADRDGNVFLLQGSVPVDVQWLVYPFDCPASTTNLIDERKELL
jgi:hypothetical protein